MTPTCWIAQATISTESRGSKRLIRDEPLRRSVMYGETKRPVKETDQVSTDVLIKENSGFSFLQKQIFFLLIQLHCGLWQKFLGEIN